jgi:hypothetical protein
LYLKTDESHSYRGKFRLDPVTDEKFILISRDYVPKSSEKTTQEESFVGTLVHEMLHRFLRLYTCGCEPCRNVTHPSVSGPGKTGHGPCWVDAMLEIGQTLQDVVQWRVDVGLVISIENEMEGSNWEPTLQELRRWNVTPTRYRDGELATYGWLKSSRRKEWELQRPDRDELIRRRKEEEDKQDKDVSDKTHDMIGWYLFEDGRQKDQPHPSIWEQDEHRIEKEMRDVARKYVAERGGKEKYLQMKLQEWGEKAREKEKEQERARDRRRLGTTSTSTSREEDEHRHRRRARKEEQQRQEKERNEQERRVWQTEEEERKRKEEKEIPGKLQEWLEQQQQSIEQTPEMNPKKEQLAPRYPGLPPMPPSARRRSANGSSGPRRASTADSPPRRADDPEVANERSMRRKIKETSRKLWNWRR